jgi:hypothetical protein
VTTNHDEIVSGVERNVPISDLSMTYNNQNYMTRHEQPKKLHRTDKDKAAFEASPFKSGVSLGSTLNSKSIRKNRAATHLGLEMTKSH